MKFAVVVSMLLAASITPAAFGTCQQAGSGGNLAQQLQSAYVPTVLENNGLKVAQSGCVLVIQKEGVAAYPAFSKLASADNIYEDGELRSGTRSKIFGGLTQSRPLAPARECICSGLRSKKTGSSFKSRPAAHASRLRPIPRTNLFGPPLMCVFRRVF